MALSYIGLTDLRLLQDSFYQATGKPMSVVPKGIR